MAAHSTTTLTVRERFRCNVQFLTERKKVAGSTEQLLVNTFTLDNLEVSITAHRAQLARSACRHAGQSLSLTLLTPHRTTSHLQGTTPAKNLQ